MADSGIVNRVCRQSPALIGRVANTPRPWMPDVLTLNGSEGLARWLTALVTFVALVGLVGLTTLAGALTDLVVDFFFSGDGVLDCDFVFLCAGV